MDIGKVLNTIVFFFFGIAELVLGLRFFLRLLGANSGAEFTQSIYEASGAVAGPFEGVFPTFEVAQFTLELSTLLAMAVYGLFGFILYMLIQRFEGTTVRPSAPKPSNRPQQQQPMQPAQMYPNDPPPPPAPMPPQQPMQDQPPQHQPMQEPQQPQYGHHQQESQHSDTQQVPQNQDEQPKEGGDLQ